MAEETAATDGFTVKLARSGKRVFVPNGGSILFELLQEDVQVPYSCGVGICGACWQRVVSGRPDHRDFVLSDEERDKGAVMICCAGSLTAELELDL
ncbi:MAG: 2Fe-2S iron-sulfur cluster binding domain-containing protein [Gammaproteobacteria bacterium]|nr:2Fe-2S iron-sulfur cluster binding domain-containing protein [Gammaproteobacteria bacterium]MYF31735.1 2Fe-2S iron-sulfur cluster binding domain-containing protein [Gammaproteobacteria bacterium]MYK46640.1 2Fe-2S iron-sulfur cluster binding domain-containing protein [Gammaproteobacteria bacterium]